MCYRCAKMIVPLAKQVSKRFYSVVASETCGTIPKAIYPSTMEKYLLVSTRIFKSLPEIPETIALKTLKRAQDRGRLLLTSSLIFGFFAAIYLTYPALPTTEDFSDKENRKVF